MLYFAHRDLEGMTLNGSVIRDKEMLMPVWAERVYQGYWYDPAVTYLTKYFELTQEHVTGEITVELFKGNLSVVGRRSPTSLYDAEIASMDFHHVDQYDQTDATGFIHLHALPLRLHARRKSPS